MPPDAHLADLGFQLLMPHPALRPYVKSYWHFRSGTPVAAFREEFMHPGGGFGLVFNFGDPLHLDGQAIAEPLFLDGATTISRAMGFTGQIEVMGVRFREGGAYPMLGIPLGELRNEPGLLDAVERPPLLELYARLLEAASLAARVQLLDAWLCGRLALGPQPSPLIPASVALIRRVGGQLSIPHLAQELAISQRQMERLYHIQVGMAPKEYSRLLRVERARLAIRRLPEPVMGALAADFGFYDQPHFIREFRAVVGVTPTTYLKRRRS